MGLKRNTDDAYAPLYTETPPGLYPAQINWIPYYLWANRGEGEMEVWLREIVLGS